jgi:PhzF family phenazine biosynthesis protein
MPDEVKARSLSIPIHTVDAFTDRAFGGNPAGVCLLETPRDEEWMQSVAREMNHSETAFLSPHEGDGFDLRWFTPVREVNLCGHATLASAHVLWENGVLGPRATARFHTRSGVLAAVQRDGAIEMDFPARPPKAAEPPAGLLEALGAKAVWSGRNVDDWLIEVESESVVRGLKPDFAKLAKVDARGAVVTSRAQQSGADFVSRFFAPRFGVDEDPVTGSAHCALAPYWAAKLGREELTGVQLSERGGRVSVRLVGERVMLGGSAVTVLRGVLV